MFCMVLRGVSFDHCIPEPVSLVTVCSKQKLKWQQILHVLYREISFIKYKMNANIIKKGNWKKEKKSYETYLAVSWSFKCLYKRKECPMSLYVSYTCEPLSSCTPKCQKLSGKKSYTWQDVLSKDYPIRFGVGETPFCSISTQHWSLQRCLEKAHLFLTNFPKCEFYVEPLIRLFPSSFWADQLDSH